MKHKNSPLKRARESEYNLLAENKFPFLTLREGAQELEITPQRLSRHLRILEVPVHRKGYTIFLDDTAIRRVTRALTRHEIKRGRRKGESRRGQQ